MEPARQNPSNILDMTIPDVESMGAQPVHPTGRELLFVAARVLRGR
jgi:hypothetical protein